MKLNDVRKILATPGPHAFAVKVSGRVVPVRIIAERERLGADGKPIIVFEGVNELTDQRVTMTAARLQGEIGQGPVYAQSNPDETGLAGTGQMLVGASRKDITMSQKQGEPKTAEIKTVTDVPITDGEDQCVVSDGPVGEAKVNRRGTKKKTATSGAQSASGASKAKATPESKTLGKRATARVGTDKSPKTGKGAVTVEKTAKKGVKKASGAKEQKPPSTITMGQLADSYAAHLEAVGKSGGTVHSYSIEMKTAVRYFGEGTRVSTLTAKKVGEYFDSDVVTKNRKGRTKDEKTVAKTRRVLRLALAWLAEVGVLKEAPIPEVKKPGKKK